MRSLPKPPKGTGWVPLRLFPLPPLKKKSVLGVILKGACVRPKCS